MKRYILLFIIIFLFHVVLDSFFLLHDKTPQSWDQSGHLLYGLTMLDLLKNGHISEALKSTYFYPPLYYLATLPIYLIEKAPPFPIFINVFFLLLLLVSVYRLAAGYFNKTAGLLAALIVASYPWVIFQRRNYLLDFPLTAMIAASMYSFYLTDGLTKRRQTVIAAVAAALCLLTKELGAVYIIPFYIFTLLSTLYQKRQLKTVFTNGIFFVIIAVAIASVWYVPNIRMVQKGFSELSVYAEQEKDPTGLTIASLRYYFDQFRWQLSPVLFALVPLSAAALFVNRNRRRLMLILVPAIGASYLFFTLIPNKDPRYSLPFVVYFAILSAGALSLLKQHRIISALATVCIVFLCAAQSLSLTIGWPAINSPYFVAHRAPNTSDWKLSEIVAYIHSLSPQTNPIVAVLPDHPQINVGTLRYYSVIRDTPFNVISLLEPNNNASIHDNINRADFIVYKSNYQKMTTQTPNYTHVYKAYQIFDSLKGTLSPIKTFAMPDDSDIIIYTKNNAPL